jgi:uncharacterized membrane protein
MSKPARLTSLDLIRGVVMVLMVIDHVRVYAGVPAGGPTPGVFFTRWVTHFCAPAFVFFAGTAAFLHGRTLPHSSAGRSFGLRARLRPTAEASAKAVGGAELRSLSRFLITRGLLLVVLEITLIRFSWTFNLAYSEWILAGVIWMLGWCMVLLAGLVRLRIRTIAVLGLLLIVGQYALSQVPKLMPPRLAWWWEFVYPSGFEGDDPVIVLYTLVPWIGVMAAGYAFGSVLVRGAHERTRLCLWIGLTATAIFLVVATAEVLRAPATVPWSEKIFGALSPSKYPASPMFLLMTLGPAIALLPMAGRARGWLASFFTTFGRVPMFFYLLHIPLIHVLALGVNYVREGAMHHEWYATAPYAVVPPEHQWSLGLLYLIFVVATMVLYPLCRWFSRYKASHDAAWLRLI